MSAPDRLDLRTKLGNYTGQEVIDIEMRRAGNKGFSPYAVGIVIGTINAVRAFGAIDEPAYIEAFRRLASLEAGGAQ